MSELGWTDAQWDKVNRAITEAFEKSNVAERFVTCYGPLGESAETVRAPKLIRRGNSAAKLSIEDDTTTKLFNLTVKVTLSSEQVAEESLSSALVAFRRAGATLAQVEDDVVFNGYDPAVQQQNKANKKRQREEELTLDVVRSGPPKTEGLASKPDAGQPLGRQSRSKGQNKIDPPDQEGLVKEIAKAVVSLESEANPGPFACVLGTELFALAHTPTKGSLVLPTDRITPLLDGGPLLRSGSMLPTHGIVVSLATDVIDIVIATPPRAQYLQRDDDAKYVFRVYEKFVLRIKDADKPPVYTFEL